MVHFGHFTWSDVQEMSPRERDWHYEQLIEIQKNQLKSISSSE